MDETIIDELRWRGLVAQTTDGAGLRAALAGGSVTLYAGFDPTGPSLHVGHLVPLLTLRRFQLAGHRPIALAGGATGLIGDLRDVGGERPLLSAYVVRGYAERIGGQLAAFLDFEGPGAATLVNNLDWTGELPVVDFLRDIGKHFSVNVMLGRDAIRRRLDGEGISFTEFSYLLLQSMDFLELHRRTGCSMQIGGSDQWGNIVAGVDLIRRVEGVPAHALTVPLVTSASGAKFGKSTGGGSMWLDPELTSPYAWYQYWINTDDRDVVGRLKTFTFLDRVEIEALAEVTVARPAARAAQRTLAEQATTLVHGRTTTEQVQAASSALFGQGELRPLPAAMLEAALLEAGTLRLAAGLPVAAMLQQSGLCASTSAARRAVAEGGAYVNNTRVTDAGWTPRPEDLLHGRWLVLRRGKRAVAGVEIG